MESKERRLESARNGDMLKKTQIVKDSSQKDNNTERTKAYKYI